MTRHRNYYPTHPLYDRMCRLNCELSLQILTYQIVFAAYVIRAETAKPANERVIDVQHWSQWLEARRSWSRLRRRWHRIGLQSNE